VTPRTTSMRISFDHPAEAGERFAPDAFDVSVGKEVRLSVQGRPSGTCRLVAAEVASDGSSVMLTYDVPNHYGEFIARLPNDRAVTPFSLGFTFPPAESGSAEDEHRG
jgi:hypothetical protein